MRHRHQTGPALPPQLHGRGIPPAASEHPPLTYSTVDGSSRGPGPANGALGYLALFLYGSSAIFAPAAMLFRHVRGAEETRVLGSIFASTKLSC